MSDIVSHREQRRLETQLAIYHAGIELFAERGYSGTTVAQVARRARIAQRTFFTYYASKKDILFGVPQEYCDALAAHLNDGTRNEPTLVVFRQFLLGIVTSPPPEYFRQTDMVVYVIVFQSPELKEYAYAMKQRLIDAFALSYARDFDCELDDFAARVAAETTVNALWAAGKLLFPFEDNYSAESIEVFVAELYSTFSNLLDQARLISK